MARPGHKPDEHPRPQVMVPMSVFGDLFFTGNYERVGRWVHYWTFAAWKKDSTYTRDGLDPVGLALNCGWLTRDDSGLRMTGSNKDPRWLVDAAKEWITYAIEALGHGVVKIGRTNDVSRRLDELQCASPHRLRLIGAVSADHERALHSQLRGEHVGGEWFRLSDVTRAALGAHGVI